MSSEKKSIKVTRKTVKPDVEKPGQSAPSATSRPVIVTNRPIMKDPMVAGSTTSDDEPVQGSLKHDSGGPKLQPDEEVLRTSESEQADEPAPIEPEAKTPDDEIQEPPVADNAAEPVKKDDKEKETAEKTVREAEIEQLIESRRYELPINTVEKRKAKHFVVIGILLAILLALVWADIALDAGLINIDGIKPVTHFFSN